MSWESMVIGIGTFIFFVTATIGYVLISIEEYMKTLIKYIRDIEIQLKRRSVN